MQGESFLEVQSVGEFVAVEASVVVEAFVVVGAILGALDLDKPLHQRFLLGMLSPVVEHLALEVPGGQDLGILVHLPLVESLVVLIHEGILELLQG